MKLAVNHIAHARIVTARDCDPVTRYAAEELSRFLGEIAGCAFQIVNDKQEPMKHDILVGLSKRTAQYADRFAALPREGYFYCNDGENLVFGGTGRGLLYGVYAFLEDELGIRFFNPDVTHVPRRRSIEIGALDRSDAPVMEYREPSIAEFRNTEFTVRRRVNGNFARSRVEKFGDGVGYALGYFVHTFTRIGDGSGYFITVLFQAYGYCAAFGCELDCVVEQVNPKVLHQVFVAVVSYLVNVTDDVYVFFAPLIREHYYTAAKLLVERVGLCVGKNLL